MTDDDQPNISPRKNTPRSRSGGEKRKRGGRIMFRVSDEESAAIEAAAERERVSVGGYVRSRALVLPTTGAQRRSPADVIALARLQGELNRIGGSIALLRREVNSGRLIDPFHEIGDAFQGYNEAIAAVMAATTRAYGDHPPEPEPEPDEEEAARDR